MTADDSVPKSSWRCPACRQFEPTRNRHLRMWVRYGAEPPLDSFPAPPRDPDDARPASGGQYGAPSAAPIHCSRSGSGHATTIRHIVSTNPELHLYVLLTLGAFFSSIDRASGRNLGERIPLWAILVLALALAPLAIPLSVLGAMLVAVGRSVRSWVAWRPERAGSTSALACAAVPVITGRSRSSWPM